MGVCISEFNKRMALLKDVLYLSVVTLLQA
jgi:hypothetical protein